MSKLGRSLKVTKLPAPRRVVEVEASFACGHSKPLRVQLDAAFPEMEPVIRERLKMAQGRAPTMPCLQCAHDKTAADWALAINGDQSS